MKNSMRRTSLVLSMLALAAGPALGQAYPAKPIRMVLATAAGGPPDIIMRGMSEPIRAAFGQPIIIEAIPAGDGIVAAQTVMRTPADGYTLMMASGGPITVNPAFQTARLPYDPQKDFQAVAMVAQFNSVIVSNAALPVNSLRELVAMAKAKPGSLNFATAGTPTTSNLYAEWFRKTQGVDFYNVPYKSNSQALQAVVAGEAHATVFAAGNAMSQAKAGKVKVLALIADGRNPAYPDVPALKEEGVDLVIRNWYGLFVRTGTPRDIVERWNSVVSKTVGDPAFQQKVLLANGMERASPSGESVDAFEQFLKRDRALYERLKSDTGIKID
jgi:tripartite-type tricarboxylate transporter receptor subunit TctC